MSGLRKYELTEDGGIYAVVLATSSAAALRVAKRNVARANYEPIDDSPDTWPIHVEVMAVPLHEGEYEACDEVLLQQPEPPCADGRSKHDWLSGQACGHGGGVIVDDTCRFCGRVRHTDTWHTNPVTGEQGYHAVTYRPADPNWLPEWTCFLDALLDDAEAMGARAVRCSDEEGYIELESGIAFNIYASCDGYEYQQVGSTELVEFDGTLEDLL